MNRGVVVTGLGVVSPVGASIEMFWENLLAGRCGIEKHEFRSDDLCMSVPCAPVSDCEDQLNALGRDLGRADRFSKLAVLAADQAIKSSGLEFDDALGARTACLIGTGIGGQTSLNDSYVGMLRHGRRPHPLTILRLIPNAAASHLSIRYGLRGPSYAISSACASGAHAIGASADLIRTGAADIAVAGASEAILNYGALDAWRSMYILADETCRPFSKNRNGLVIGEGAGVLILEEEERAKKRGAEIFARIAGFGMNADGKDMINPSPAGAAAAISLALDGVRAENPDRVYINAHGTGTLANDPAETKAVKLVFGDGAERLVISSTKSMHGHLLGAAGGVECVASILALRRNVAPPTINFDERDPECDLNYAPNEPVERKIDLAISNSFAFGGLNAVVAFSKV